MANDRSLPRLSIVEKIGYGLGDAGCNVVFQMTMTFMAYFYTDVFGLEAAAMGTLLLVTRAVASLADPIAGLICDRTETRWGKFRPYLLWMSVPLAAIAVLTFTTPNISPGGKLIYAYVTSALLMVGYAAINVPYCALGAVLTPNAQERVSLNGYRFCLATGGGALVVASTLPLVSLLGRGNAQVGFPLTMAVLSSVAIGMFVACFFATKERVVPASPQESHYWRDVKLLFKNDQWMVVAALNLILFVALAIQDSSTIYYVTWYVGRTDLVGPFLTTGMVSSMIGALCAGPLTARLSKANAYLVVQVLIVTASIALFSCHAYQVPLLFALYAIQQFFTQMASPILWSMTADTADYGEYLTGRRITGLTFSGALLSLKLGTAIGGALLGWLLADFGYESQAVSQSAQTIYGIVVVFTLVPAIGHLTLIVLTRFYRLDKARCDEIQAELARRHAAQGTGPPPPPSTRS